MTRRRHVSGIVALVGVVSVAPFVAACAGAPGGTELAPTEGQMIGHYGRFSEIQASLVKGDLAAAQVAANSLTTRPMPPTTTQYAAMVRRAADEIARAGTVAEAAQAAGRMGLACGGCHAALDERPNVRFTGGAPRGDSRAEHMARANWALDQLLDGMIANDNEFWMNGANVFLDDDQLGMTGEIVAAAQGEQRGVVYGEVVQACADCHTKNRP